MNKMSNDTYKPPVLVRKVGRGIHTDSYKLWLATVCQDQNKWPNGMWVPHPQPSHYTVHCCTCVKLINRFYNHFLQKLVIFFSIVLF